MGQVFHDSGVVGLSKDTRVDWPVELPGSRLMRTEKYSELIQKIKLDGGIPKSQVRGPKRSGHIEEGARPTSP